MTTRNGPASERLWWPDLDREFAEHTPTEDEWAAELESGWAGSNGSSVSLDDIEGVRIGLTSRAYRPDLPANLHDYQYRVLRRLLALRRIDETTRAEMQRAADRRHLCGLQHKLLVLVGFDGWKARRRARLRYTALRWFGKSATLPGDTEAYRVGTVDGPAAL